MIDATRELLTDAADSIRRQQPPPAEPIEEAALPGPREPLRVLGYAANGAADELALTMLAHSLDDLPITIEMTKRACWLPSWCRSCAQGVSIVCLADLPPSPLSKTRYLVKRLHDALPELRILVGRWRHRRWRMRARRRCGTPAQRWWRRRWRRRGRPRWTGGYSAAAGARA